MSYKSLGLIPALVISAIASASCANPSQEGAVSPTSAPAQSSEWQPPTAISVDGRSAIVASRQTDGALEGYPEARVFGQLTVLDGGCFGLRQSDGSTSLLIWPPATAVLPNGEGVEVPDYGPVRVGEQIEQSGGCSDRSQTRGAVPPEAESCVFDVVTSVNPFMSASERR